MLENAPFIRFEDANYSKHIYINGTTWPAAIPEVLSHRHRNVCPFYKETMMLHFMFFLIRNVEIYNTRLFCSCYLKA